MRNQPRVLIVEDEPAIAELVAVNLRHNGFQPIWAMDAVTAQKELDEVLPDVILLDWMLPGESGLSLAKRWRSNPRSKVVPILMITARGDEPDRVAGLDAGADDYIVKPFKPKELVARLRARVRRSDEPSAGTLEIGDVTIDVAGHVVRRAGKVIPLTPLEFDLLVCLARKPWQVFTREVLLEQVWGYRHAADTRLVNVHVQRLRSKVEHDPENPEIVWRSGIGDPSSATMQAADPTGGAVPAALQRWRMLSQSGQYSFSEYASFLMSYPDWPNTDEMRKNAEQAINVLSWSPNQVVAYFDKLEPVTNGGRAKFALALAAGAFDAVARRRRSR